MLSATQLSGIPNRRSRLGAAALAGAFSMAFFFFFAALSAGVGWDVAGISAGVGIATSLIMWILFVPSVAGQLARPIGRLLFVLAGMGIAQITLVGDSKDEGFAPFVGLTVAGCLLLTGFWRRWVVWKPFPKQSTGDVLASTLGALVVLTVLFGYFTAMLQANGVVTIKARFDDDALWAFEGYYAWHLLDVVPVLKIPATLNLPDPVEVTDIWAGGVLLLLYKVLVAVPVIGVVTQLFAQRHDDADAGTSDEGARDQPADS
jgi:hypothetical protein